MPIVKGGTAERKHVDEEGNRPCSEPTSDSSASLAAVIASLSAQQPQVTVRTVAPEPEVVTETDYTPIYSACKTIAEDAIDRIHAIAMTQVERFRTQYPNRSS